MTRVEALLEALDLQVRVGDALRVEHLTEASQCGGWTVRQVLEHSIGVTLKFAAFASGATDEPCAPRGDLVEPDHRLALRKAADQARSAWESADLTRSCRLAFGLFTADLAAGINLFDVLAHSWDVSAALDVDLHEFDELWVLALDAAREVIGFDRDRAHYGPEVTVADDCSPMARFLAFVGRAPERP